MRVLGSSWDSACASYVKWSAAVVAGLGTAINPCHVWKAVTVSLTTPCPGNYPLALNWYKNPKLLFRYYSHFSQEQQQSIVITSSRANLMIDGDSESLHSYTYKKRGKVW